MDQKKLASHIASNVVAYWTHILTISPPATNSTSAGMVFFTFDVHFLMNFQLLETPCKSQQEKPNVYYVNHKCQ